MGQPIGPFSSVTVFGGASIDRIGRSHATPNAGASNPGTITVLPGGVGLNVATILARLGVEAQIAARIGADNDGEAVIAAAHEAGVGTTLVGVSPTAATAGYLASLDEKGDLIVGIADMAVFDEMTPAVVAPLIANPRAGEAWVIDANLPSETIGFLVGEANAACRPIMALTVSPKKAVRLLPYRERLTVLFTNRREGAALLGRAPHDPDLAAMDLARELASPLAGNVIVSDGGAPIAVTSGGKERTFATLKADIHSVNGAGDALAAGVIYGLGHGRSLFEAAIEGLAAAAITLESDGRVGSTFGPDALATRIAEPHRAS